MSSKPLPAASMLSTSFFCASEAYVAPSSTALRAVSAAAAASPTAEVRARPSDRMMSVASRVPMSMVFTVAASLMPAA